MFVPTGLTWHVHRRWTSTSPSICQVVKLSSWLSSSIIFSPASENLSRYVWDCCASADMRCALVLGNRASQQGYCQFPPAVWAPLMVKHVTRHFFQDQWPLHIFSRYSSCWGSLLFGFALVPFDPVSGVAFPFIPPLSCSSIFFALVCCPPVLASLRYLHVSFSVSCSILRFTLLLGLFFLLLFSSPWEAGSWLH